ncbi:hypothetical protein JD844_003703 [Phrynosoma platyrhinos]|uniref:Coiled-coil domain-containing protein 13 n=1 Tax=Phrynosoma platyrhinos TaxID=52577 RepID=A0ABQ7TD49_PHRPL|nr:hypothetical protein JD844_003703 [Phrynosoma platyrhinos]
MLSYGFAPLPLSLFSFAGTSGLSGDVAATKIVELAKQNRHLTAEVEREKVKVKQLNNRIKGLEKELQMTLVKLHSHGDKNSQSARKTTEASLNPEGKALLEKLTAANLKISEYRNQLQTTKQELKMTQKLLANEVGEDVDIQNLLTTPGTWRGRAQRILVLQSKVRELENQLGHSKSRLSENGCNDEVLNFTDSRKESAQEKNLQRIRSLEKEKKEALEKDHEEVKKKLDGAKSRNKVLSNEVKTLKEQISSLLEKGKHDDELIDALMNQQKEMQVILKNLSQQDERNKEGHQSLGVQLNVELQKQNCLINQLKQMVAEREARVKELEEKVRQLTMQHHLHHTDENTNSISTMSAESLEEGDYISASKKEGLFGSNTSTWTVSKMGHTLVDSAATSFPFTASPGRVDDSTTKVWEAEKKFQEQQRRSVALEQQVEKLKTESGKSTGSAKAHSKSKAAQLPSSTRQSLNMGDKKDFPSAQLSEVPLESQIEELSTRQSSMLAIQIDENEGLKNALQVTMKTKEEDFQVYQETVGQVKEIFLQALKQQKQDRN